MKQTAIQELISELKALKQTKVLMPSLNAIDDCINLAYAKLEIEKQQIINSHLNGQAEFDTEAYRHEVITNAEQHYNETFKSE